MSTPRESFFPTNTDTDNTSQSQASSRTQTALGYSRISTRDFGTGSVGRRASSEPTPTLPVVELSEAPETPLDPPSESGEDTDYEKLTGSVYVTPSEDIIISPARSLQTISYDSRPSTPERLPSPSSLVSPCSPRYEPEEQESPTHFSPPSSASSSISSPVSLSYARTAQSFVTAALPARSSTSRQSTRSTTSTNVKAFSARSSSPAVQPTILPPSSPIMRPPSQASHRSLHARGAFWSGHSGYTSRPAVPAQDDQPGHGSRRSSRSRSGHTPSLRSPEGSEKSSSRTMTSRSAAPQPSVSPEAQGEGRGDAPRKPASASEPPHPLAWHCRLCLQEPHDPTVTMCGHLFCHGCIVKELAKNLQCPACKKMMLVRLHVQC